MRTKQTFLAVYDYGMGGIWLLMDAGSPREIERAYPELQVVAERPDWLDAAEWGRLEESWHFDLDQPPSGWLETLVRQRSGDDRSGEAGELAGEALCRGPFHLAGVLGIVGLHVAVLAWALLQLGRGHELLPAAAPALLGIAVFWVAFVLLAGLWGRNPVTNGLGIGCVVACWLALPALAIWWVAQRLFF